MGPKPNSYSPGAKAFTLQRDIATFFFWCLLESLDRIVLLDGKQLVLLVANGGITILEA